MRQARPADVPRVQGELPPAGVQGAAPLAPLLPFSFSFPFPFVSFVFFVTVVSFVISNSLCPSVCPLCPLWSSRANSVR